MAYEQATGGIGSWQRTLKRALEVVREVKNLHQKNAYVRVTLHDGDSFFLSDWCDWEEERTGEKLVLLMTRGRSVITDSRNIIKFEVYYKRPKEKEAIGIKYEELPSGTAQGK